MPIFNFTATKSYYICNIDGQSITINNSDQIAFDMDTLSMPEVRSLAIGVYYNELETNDNDSFTAYYTGLLGDISNPNSSGGLTESQVNALIDTKLEDFTPSSSGGGFVFGGDWDATPIAEESASIPSFDVLHNATISGNVLTRITANVDFGATATNLSHSANVGTWHKFRVTVPDTTSGFFRIALHTSNQSEPSLVFTDESAQLCGLGVGHGSSLSISIYNHSTLGTYTLSETINAGDVIRVEYRSDIDSVCFYNETGGGKLLRKFDQHLQYFNVSPVHLTVFADNVGTTLSFDFADDYPIYQTIFNLDYPEDLTKTYRVSAANANSAINSKLLKAADFVDFITNEDDEVVDVVVSRLVSDSNIRDTISTTLNDTNSSLYSLVRDLGGVGGVDAVVSALGDAVNDSPSNLTTNLDSFLAYLLNHNTSLFYSTFQTLVQDAVYAYIQNAVQVNGDIYTAIEQYVSESATGNIYPAFILSAIENNIENYANGIGVGNNGQPYLDVTEAALAAISNEVQSGGIIEAAIQTAINP